jgi:hypothetical protein
MCCARTSVDLHQGAFTPVFFFALPTTRHEPHPFSPCPPTLHCLRFEDNGLDSTAGAFHPQIGKSKEKGIMLRFHDVSSLLL